MEPSKPKKCKIQLEPEYLWASCAWIKNALPGVINDFGVFTSFEDYDIAVAYGPRASAHPLGSIGVFELAKDKFLILGTECTVNFRVKPGENAKVDYIRLEEGEIIQGEWKAGRILNGDEKMAIKFGDMPKAYMVELYKY